MSWQHHDPLLLPVAVPPTRVYLVCDYEEFSESLTRLITETVRVARPNISLSFVASEADAQLVLMVAKMVDRIPEGLTTRLQRYAGKRERRGLMLLPGLSGCGRNRCLT